MARIRVNGILEDAGLDIQPQLVFDESQADVQIES